MNETVAQFYETINRLGCHNGGNSSFLNPVFKRLALRDSKALQEVDWWLDYSFSALCRGTCRQAESSTRLQQWLI